MVRLSRIYPEPGDDVANHDLDYLLPRRTCTY